ncbi:effector-associated domain 2-containing protein [Actinosynnema pretiosum]|uniref:effector-associated domain 2-containing protein n=1 Tax=Actinosynnema pretiosum TaxID=42197 RepID=UPI0012FD63E5|nr:hypothetical protein [Actinosynnema pretiosum]
MLSPSLPLHHGIVMLDVEGYGSGERTDEHRASVHNGLNRAVRSAFSATGADWTACTYQDGGDGGLLLVPASVPKLLLLGPMLASLAAEITRHNAVSSPEAAIRLRCCLHAGEVRSVEHGIVGGGVVHASRLLASEPLRAARRGSDSPVVLIVSDLFYQDVVRHDPAEEPDRYRRVDVAVKELRAPAWIRDGVLAAPTGGSGTGPSPAAPVVRFTEVVDALLAVPSVHDEASRRFLLDVLSARIRDAVPHHPRTRFHVHALVRTCAGYEGGLAELLSAVRELEGDSEAVRRAEVVVRSWTDAQGRAGS